MSYYTFFYPKRGYNNPDNLQESSLIQKKREAQQDVARYKAIIKALMIDAYFNEADNLAGLDRLYDKIRSYVYMYKSYYDDLEKYDWAVSIEDKFKEVDEGKEKEVRWAVNHLNFYDENELDSIIESENNIVDNAAERLIILSRIKVKNKDDNDLKTYLQESYMEEIDDIFSQIEYTVEKAHACKFYKEFWSTKKATVPKLR